MTERYAVDYLAVVLAIGVPVVLLGAALAAASLLAPRVRTARMGTAYECGMPPAPGFSRQINARYFLFAILFMIFDVEAIFLFPWAVIFPGAGLLIFLEMLLFVAILLFGLLYTIRKGVLRWS
ncbi:MAG: NADH-quinone oxidoreductase subunit A [Chloroflexota bacterium]|nr:NADH-quinone oxidoreductase subunit A [Dehalococcoidia bacterium]MDW8254859.1 NADH-quinone oxidoreductase subunit A [Chloroflexota bacterium]